MRSMLKYLLTPDHHSDVLEAHKCIRCLCMTMPLCTKQALRRRGLAKLDWNNLGVQHRTLTSTPTAQLSERQWRNG